MTNFQKCWQSNIKFSNMVLSVSVNSVSSVMFQTCGEGLCATLCFLPVVFHSNDYDQVEEGGL